MAKEWLRPVRQSKLPLKGWGILSSRWCASWLPYSARCKTLFINRMDVSVAHGFRRSNDRDVI